MTETMTAAEYQAQGAKPPKVSKSEQIARTFALHIRARKLPEPRCRFHPEGELRFMAGEVIERQNRRLKRRTASPSWRFDFAWPDRLIAVEVEGVSVRKDATTGKTQLGGRHAHITGFKDDCEKYAWAAVMGWRVLRFEQSQVVKGFAIDMLVRLWHALEVNTGAVVMEALRELEPPRGPGNRLLTPAEAFGPRITTELDFGGKLDRDPF
jgi:very-short-patch-repair endonuclease